MQKIIRRIVLLTLLTAPFAAWAFFKPVRVLAPELLGLSCTAQGVCVDDPARLAEAVALKQEAVDFVQNRIGALHAVPRAIFCASAPCAKAFGFTSNAAYNVGTLGLVVSPRGWHPYYLRHELIHHLQNERLGSLNAWWFKPAWFVEGMAYSLSEDPRHPLPAPLEGYRVDFDAWARQFGTGDLWVQAERL